MSKLFFSMRTPRTDGLPQWARNYPPVELREEGWHCPIASTEYHYFRGQDALCGYHQPSRIMSEDLHDTAMPKCPKCRARKETP